MGQSASDQTGQLATTIAQQPLRGHLSRVEFSVAAFERDVAFGLAQVRCRPPTAHNQGAADDCSRCQTSRGGRRQRCGGLAR
jgi:hypothetical protein